MSTSNHVPSTLSFTTKEVLMPSWKHSYQLVCRSICAVRRCVASVVIIVIVFIFLNLLIGSFYSLLFFCRVEFGDNRKTSCYIYYKTRWKNNKTLLPSITERNHGMSYMLLHLTVSPQNKKSNHMISNEYEKLFMIL